MWTINEVIELAVLILAAGTAFGLSLRAFDEWSEKRQAAQVAAALAEPTATKTE